MRINSGSNEDLRVRRHTRAFFSKPLENSNQKVLLCLSKTLYYQPQALKLPILLKQASPRAQTKHNSLHLTFVYVSAILSFVSTIRSGTYQLLPCISFSFCFHRTLLFSSTNLTVLIVSNGLGIQFFGTRRQAEHDSTTTGQAKLVGVTESSDLTSVYGYEHSHFTPGLQSAFYTDRFRSE